MIRFVLPILDGTKKYRLYVHIHLYMDIYICIYMYLVYLPCKWYIYLDMYLKVSFCMINVGKYTNESPGSYDHIWGIIAKNGDPYLRIFARHWPFTKITRSEGTRIWEMMRMTLLLLLLLLLLP